MKKILFTFLLLSFINKTYAIEDIKIDNDYLIPRYEKDIKRYNYFTINDKIHLNIKPSKEEIVNYESEYDINDGINLIKVNSSINGDYLIFVFKNYKEDKDTFGKLINLEIENHDINFNPDIHEYNISINDEDILYIKTELLNDSSYVEIDGNGNFNNDKNIITINVDNINTYTINVFKTLPVFKEEVKEEKIKELSVTKKEIVKLSIITISCSLVFIMFYLLFIKKLF